MDRSRALDEAQLIGVSLLARLDPPLTGVPFPATQLPLFALPPNETGERVCRAMTVFAPPGVDALALLADDWDRAGAQPMSWATPDGVVLVGVHPAGFVLVLHRRAGRDELYVVSPIIKPSVVEPGPNRGLFGGMAVGAIFGLVGPCFSFLLFQSAFDDRVASLGFVPLVLLLGCAMLFSPDSRQFGVGLLIGAAATGIVTAGVCVSLLQA